MTPKVPQSYCLKRYQQNQGINLLNTTLKLVTKIITNKIKALPTLGDEQQRFRSERSCTDAVFILRQITECNKPAFIHYVFYRLGKGI